MGRRVYRCNLCDFDLCESCYLKLPDRSEGIALKSNIEQLKRFSLIYDDDSNDSDWTE